MKIAFAAAALSLIAGVTGLLDHNLNARTTPHALSIEGPGVLSFDGAFARGQVKAATPLVTHAKIDPAQTPIDRLRLQLTTERLGGSRAEIGLRPISCLDGADGLICSARLSTEPVPVGTILHYQWLYRAPTGRLRELGPAYGLIIVPAVSQEM
ncbi:MAG: hypothetical protein AAFR93_11260 [Pseudomonadota bacterium]